MGTVLFRTLLFFLSTSGGLILSGDAQALIKCWENDEGVRECGNTVPPEYVQKGYQEIRQESWVSTKKERVKTEKELAEEERLVRVETERKRHEEKQKNLDEALLKTFSSVDDIERLRDDRVSALEGTIKLAQKRKEKLLSALDSHTERAANMERSGTPPSENFLNKIDSLERQIKNNDDFIAQKRLEQQDIKKTHNIDIKRFKELKRIQ